MKSKIIASIAILGFAVTVSADVLLWQVPNSQITASTAEGGTQEIGSGDWTYAMLKYTTESDLSGASVSDIIKDPAATAYWYGDNVGTKLGSGYVGQTLSSDYDSTYNYYIALFNNSGLVGYSSILGNVDDFKAASHNMADWAGVNVAAGSGWTAAPEPTSGVLLLLGAAVLGLRRRKVA